MRRGDLIFLDSGVVSLLAYPRAGARTAGAWAWARSMAEAEVRLFLPELADYEVRRELTRVGASGGLARLDGLRSALEFAPITPPAMLLAARFWAESRRRGRPTGPDAGLDGDAILAAMALTAAGTDLKVVVASPNVRHLAQFVDARPWEEIAPPAEISRASILPFQSA